MLPAKDFCFGTIDYSEFHPDSSCIKFTPVLQTDEDAISTTSIMDYPKASLPEDVLIDIFQRLPINSICKFKCLSTVWLSRLSNLSDPILNNFKPVEKSWAIFSNNHMSTQFISSCKELSGHDGFNFSFLSRSHRLSGRKLNILASSNGLVLCSAVNDSTAGIRSYFVCNPIMKQSVSVPPPPKNSVDGFSYGLVCDTNSHSPSIACMSAFKVVRIETKLGSKTGFEVEIYFSDLDKWRTYNVAYLNPRRCTKWDAFVRNVITHDGVVYWIEEDEINRVVAYDLKVNNYEQCNVFSVPSLSRHYARNPATVECIGVSEDFVCYAHMRRTGDGKYVFRNWVLNDASIGGDYDYISKDYHSYDCRNEKSVWENRCEITLWDVDWDVYPRKDPKEYWLMGFSPENCDVVILADGDQIFTYDLTNWKEKLRPLCDPSSKSCFNQLEKSEFLHSLCVPLEDYEWGGTQHAYAVIVTPTLTAISKARG